MFYSLPKRSPSSSETAREDSTDVAENDENDVPSHKPHFLDYDAMPPEFEENFEKTLTIGTKKTDTEDANIISNSGEQLKLEKKYERDGEISDYELAASGYTKKEFTQDDNTLHLTIGECCNTDNIDCSTGRNLTSMRRSKHVHGDTTMPVHVDERRNLDPNAHGTKSISPLSVRRSTLDHVSSGLDSMREYQKKPSYTLSRFLDSDIHQVNSFISLPQEMNTSLYNGLQMPFSCDIDDLDPKVECVHSLLSMLGSNNPLEMSKKFFELSRTPEACANLRRSGCIPLLVQIMYSEGEGVRKWAGMALRNCAHSHFDEKAGRREAKVIRLLDQIVDYCNFLKTLLQSGGEAIADDTDQHPLAAISSLMKISFDEEHRQAMCELGALQAIPSLVHLDHAVHGPRAEDQCCNSLRRYALMALTNLTFGDESNKALLCSQKLFMEALVAQLDSAPDDLLQVTASVLRNLSWRADSTMKSVLNEIGTVTALAHAAMKNKSENTLKAILSALWNLSAHCSTNKAEFCAVDGALAFLVNMLTYEGPSKTLKIIENAGGILRNVSSHIAVCENYRQILRKQNCLSILLQQLKSESLTVVSNSCGTLWNLSARCPQDQKFLWENGAVPMLRSLINSKHAMISEGSSSALKNLLNFRPSIENQNHIDPIARSMGLKKLPTLHARKQKALEQELDEKEHMETCDNLDAATEISKQIYDTAGSIQTVNRFTITDPGAPSTSRLAHSVLLTRSESRDSVFSAKSDSVYEHFMRSHSANDSNRKLQKPPLVASTANFISKNTTEPAEEQPIDYSVKYKENITEKIDDLTKAVEMEENSIGIPVVTKYAAYQETDLDQLTDFSLRYAENHIEPDVDTPQQAGNVSSSVETAMPPNSKRLETTNIGSEVMLVLEDSVKCYVTEDTPYNFSNATSVSDLRQHKIDNVDTANPKPIVTPALLKKNHRAQQYGSGLNTPEKPINYCEEGTPGYFSRYESLSDLEESPPQVTKTCDIKTSVSNPQADNSKVAEKSKEITSALISNENEPSIIKTPNPIETVHTNGSINSAQETPLMFSRRSSMDSLVEEDVGPVDDKSSVVSDFSRLASRNISPSEIPDSPTQSMPQSPRYNGSSKLPIFSTNVTIVTPQFHSPGTVGAKGEPKPLPRSVFEDDLNTFVVENTPAQFSTATSLSNLSLTNDDDNLTHKEQQLGFKKSVSGGGDSTSTVESTIERNGLSEGEDEETGGHNDVVLLANCINIGMNRPTGAVSKDNKIPENENGSKHYFTENPPTFLYKSNSNTNLSVVSVGSSYKKTSEKDTIYDMANTSMNANRESLCLSDDFSSNVSENGAAGQSFDILQQCISIGMKNPNASKAQNKAAVDPIAMMRCGGSKLQQHVPVSDEMTKYLVEDSPCNFSVMSGLSNLTVGSSLVEPAVQLKENPTSYITSAVNRDQHADAPNTRIQEFARHDKQWQDDSLSSLSIDSEDDTNLLSQAIAAGCSRPKSNLGLRSNLYGRSSSQPIAISSESNHSQFKATSCGYQSNQHSKHKATNESYSSVESSDSNENQSKSLFELCILTGMNKSRQANNKSKGNANHEPLNSNLKQFDSLPLNLPRDKPGNSNRHVRDRKSKDEKLLLECINTGISTKSSGISVNIPTRTSKSQHSDNLLSKNVQSTPVAALEPSHQIAAFTSPSARNTAAIGVEANKLTNTSNEDKNMNNNTNREGFTNDQGNPEMTVDEENLPQEKMIRIGCEELISVQDDLSFLENTSMDEASSQQTFENRQCQQFVSVNNKHKDPDLMLKSVERLTLEFVTSAEQLRTNSYSEANLTNKTRASISAAGSDSNNTWNENTCPNDVSFPTVSVSAPGIVSDQSNKANHKEQHEFVEITPTNEELNHQTSLGFLCETMNNFTNTQPSSLETETDTLVNEAGIEMSNNVLPNIEINFKLGGEVQSAAATSGRSNVFLNNSAMANSAIIASEARVLADNCQQNSMNWIDLDNVRPPFGMESLDISGYYQDSSLGTHANSHKCFITPLSPQFSTKSPKTPRKSLPAGLVARRALGQLPVHISGSADSISLSCNLLDNIKPPSLMDELLDSMISVSSIQSEVADCQSLTANVSASNYMTATENNTKLKTSPCAGEHTYSDITTLGGEDEASFNNLTPLPSDNEFSSAESSPKKSIPTSQNNKLLTPKRKRQVTKDRFKTYTIVADAANGTPNINNDNESPIIAANNTQVITQIAAATAVEDERYGCSAEILKNSTMPIPINVVDNFEYLGLKETDYNSLEFDQNSETESCHNESITCIGIQENNIDKRETTVTEPQTIGKPSSTTVNHKSRLNCGLQKPTYVSPYSMQYQRNSKLRTPIASAKSPQKRNTNTTTTLASGNAIQINKTKTQATPATQTNRLEREGTFIKDEPTIKTTQMPVVEVLPHEVCEMPTSSKLPSKTSPQTKVSNYKSPAVRKIPTAKKPQRSNSNNSISFASPTVRAVIPSRISATTPPTRSNSNLNSPTPIASVNTASSKNHKVQSRIASIWRRVDNVMSKPQQKEPKKSSTVAGAVNNIEIRKPASVTEHKPPNRKTLRNSPIRNTAAIKVTKTSVF